MSTTQPERDGLQDKGAALSMGLFLAGAIGTGVMYDWGIKMILVTCMAAALFVWRVVVAFKP